jgi:phosphatidylcholine synthase
VNAKTDDGFFLGFPSYWNVVAFYVFVLRPPDILTVIVLLVFAFLTFVPTPYLYATRGGPFARTLNYGAPVWFVLLGMALYGPAESATLLAMISLLYPAMYLGLSALTAWKRRQRSASADVR